MLDLTFLVYRERFPVFAVFGLTLGLAQWSGNLVMQLSAAGVGTADDPMAAAFGLWGGIFLFFLLMAVLFAAGSMPVLAVLDDVLHGRPTSVRSALVKALPRMFPVAIAALLQLLVTMPFCLCFLIGALVPALILILTVPAVYFEQRGPIAAMQRSYQLQIERGGRRGAGDRNWVRAIALMIGTGLVVYALNMFAGLPLAIVQGIAISENPMPINTALGPQFLPLYVVLPLQLLGNLFTGMFLPVGILVWGVFYYDIRMRHEGLDLELGARELASEPS